MKLLLALPSIRRTKNRTWMTDLTSTHHEASRIFETNVPPPGVQGRSPAGGFGGVPPKNSFYFLCAAAGGAQEREGKAGDTPANPGKGQPPLATPPLRPMPGNRTSIRKNVGFLMW